MGLFGIDIDPRGVPERLERMAPRGRPRNRFRRGLDGGCLSECGRRGEPEHGSGPEGCGYETKCGTGNLHGKRFHGEPPSSLERSVNASVGTTLFW
jgi:hypothetical protein